MKYYLDSRKGSDRFDGSSPERAWKTFRHLNGKTLSAGDSVLLARGSHFVGPLLIYGAGEEGKWIEITAYGSGPRPVIEGRSSGGGWEINYTGSLDESAACLYIKETGWLSVSHLTLYRSYYGLLINNCQRSGGHIVVDDILCIDIQNFGQADPRVNSVGIEIAVGRGTPGRGVVLEDIEISRCECFHCGGGISVRAYGENCAVKRVNGRLLTCHDQAPTPWSYTGLALGASTEDIVFEGVCLDRCGPHWKPSGTAGVHSSANRLVFRKGYIGRMDEVGCHDTGGWDFEGGECCTLENCTFLDNAGPAIEFLGAAREISVVGCTFINNNWGRWAWGEPGVFFVGARGKAGGSGVIRHCQFVLAKGTQLRSCEPYLIGENNRIVEQKEHLTSYLTPPRVDAGGDCFVRGRTTHLKGRVGNANSILWECVVGPGEVVFEDPMAVETNVHFSKPGSYLLRLVAENDHFLYGDYVTIHCLTENEQPAVRLMLPAGKEPNGRWKLKRGGGENNSTKGDDNNQERPVWHFGVNCRGRKSSPVKAGKVFSLSCWVKLAEQVSGPRFIVGNCGGGIVEDGFKLMVNGRTCNDRAVYLETGNGTDCETAFTKKGVIEPGRWHHVVVAVDCTSEDTWGEARIYVDGSDVTVWKTIRSDMRKEGPLWIGNVPTMANKNREAPIEKPYIDSPRPVKPKPPIPSGFELVFYDDFRGDVWRNWTALSGQWRGEGGHLAARGKSEILCRHRFPGDVVMIYDCESDNPGDLSAVLNAYNGVSDNPQGDRSIEGRKLRQIDPMLGYFFGFGSGNNKYSQFLRRTGVIARYDGVITPGRVHRVACMRQGHVLTHWADGQTLFRYEDDRPISSGRQPYVSLYVNSFGIFHRLWIYAPKRHETSPPSSWRGQIRDLRFWPLLLSPKMCCV